MSTLVREMFSSIAAGYDRANDVLSLGVHRLWRRKAVELLDLRSAQLVVDLCTGTGDLAFAAARRLSPGAQVVGLDFVGEMLRLAQRKRAKAGVGTGGAVSFLQGDALALPFAAATADVVTIGFGIRNVDSPLQCLTEIRRVLRPGGRLLVLEFGQPTLPGFSAAYRFYSDTLMPFIGGALTGNREAYQYLPRTSRAFPAGKEFLRLLDEAGYTAARAVPLLSGLAYIYLATNPPQEALRATEPEADRADFSGYPQQQVR